MFSSSVEVETPRLCLRLDAGLDDVAAISECSCLISSICNRTDCRKAWFESDWLIIEEASRRVASMPAFTLSSLKVSPGGGGGMTPPEGAANPGAARASSCSRLRCFSVSLSFWSLSHVSWLTFSSFSLSCRMVLSSRRRMSSTCGWVRGS